ncbi:MAG: GAF domain-containing sensor histidine kinase [Oscillatoria sp. PMC 1068.18]|nr:GAF domain-containing sensor histidine kinase [Oscillatoria sp. PMC 1076.18]MEC4988589.1 GAF domain-containing sensor histidine kinase [Oscillatoria sp. PMC 1068.18]
MLDCSWLMLQPQLTSQLAPKVHLLIVAETISDVSPIAEILTADRINYTYDVATPQLASQFYLQNKCYHAILYSYTAKENFTSLLNLFAILEDFQPGVPLILITQALGQEVGVQLKQAGIENYVLSLQLNLGIIVLYYSDRHREWNQSTLDVVEGIAVQWALAISQQELSAELEGKIKREKLIAAISKLVNSNLPPEQSLQQITQQIGLSFEIDRVIIFTENNGEFQFCQDWRKNQQIPTLLGEKISPSQCPELFEDNSQFRLGKVSQVTNSAGYPKFNLILSLVTEEPETPQKTGLVWIPILLRDRFIGGFVLQLDSREREFSQEEIATMETIANQTAIALDYAQAYSQLQAQIKQQEQENNQSKSIFFSQMTHELRTPLTGILGFSRVLIDQLYGSLNDKQMEYMNALHSCGDHLLSLINDLLDLSKIEAKREELFLETVPVEEVCLASMSVVQEKAIAGNLELNLEIDPEIGICVADQRRLKQILVNLLSNAVKFTEAGSVIMKVNQEAEMLLFSVIDTGIGINETDLKTLFEPYRQIQTHLHQKHKGTGLGLALSRELARLHGGDLTATSEPGKGSCFTLHLPKRNWENMGD